MSLPNRSSVTDPVRRPRAVASTTRKAALRLSDDLVDRARRASEACHRSVPNQIEYWAALGRRLEDALEARQIAALLADEAFIDRVRIARNVVPDVDELLSGLEADRASGVLAAQFDDDPTVYDVPPESRPLIRRKNADGSVELGTYGVDGFVPSSDPS